ncbi:FGGY-family carbohydrate kinase [Intestinimonas sp. HCP28S3_D6]|uniref:FGGY-family carbohydrate kinase n=1 Tax=Intestinimonas sp. HCP28S3_D6 TaxID=3438942 RepID=UPI003F8B0CF9
MASLEAAGHPARGTLRRLRRRPTHPRGGEAARPTGTLEAGIPLAPPEGHAGTGMATTNAVAERTGNVTAGTSVFTMIVLEKALSRVYPEIDMVTTPTGKPVAMIHCNNCTNEINAWAEVFKGFHTALGQSLDGHEPGLYRHIHLRPPGGGRRWRTAAE